MALLDELIARFQQAQDKANAANEARFKQGLDLYDRIIKQAEAPTLQKATESALDRGRTKSVAQGTQALVSAGLSGTTTAATLGRQFEEEVGVPARLQAEDIAAQRLSGALTGKAGFIERREDVGPSYSDVASLFASAANRPAGEGKIGGGTASFTTGPRGEVYYGGKQYGSAAALRESLWGKK